MKNATLQFGFPELKLNVYQIESILGYDEGEDRELVTELIEEILKESAEICNIRAEYNIYPEVKFNNADKSIEINKINFQIKKIVFGQIKNSDSIAIFLCTAGKEIGIRSRQAIQERDMLKGYIYDIVGSVIVEAAADLMQTELEKSVISSGKKITNRYSPGYCGWYVGEQHKLFQLVPDNYCGIRLTHSALMDPVKSVSGIIGIGEKVKMNPHTCSLCEMKDCIYRKHREKQ
jgi:flavodoxin